MLVKGMGIIEQLDPMSFTNYLKKYRNTICGRHPIGVLLNVSTKEKSLISLLVFNIVSTCSWGFNRLFAKLPAHLKGSAPPPPSTVATPLHRAVCLFSHIQFTMMQQVPDFRGHQKELLISS